MAPEVFDAMLSGVSEAVWKPLTMNRLLPREHSVSQIIVL